MAVCSAAAMVARSSGRKPSWASWGFMAQSSSQSSETRMRLPADGEAEVAVAVGDRLAVAEGGGHVAGGRLALALGVLGGLAGELPRPGQVGHGGGIAEGEHPLGAGHLEIGPDPQPAPLAG